MSSGRREDEQAWPFSLDASDADISDLLEGRLLGEEAIEDDMLAPSLELQSVAQRIAGQYAEVLARLATDLFSGRPGQRPEQATGTLVSLRRLAEGAGNDAQVSLLDELDAAVSAVVEAATPTSRQNALIKLRAWIPRFAETLADDDAERLRGVVDWKAGSLPLLDELKRVRGIGPKRLGRLYSAGLFTVEIVANAAPADVAQVTGLSQTLAVDVVEAARTFADRERRRCAMEARAGAARLRKILESVKLSSDPEVLEIARTALDELQQLLEPQGEAP